MDGEADGEATTTAAEADGGAADCVEADSAADAVAATPLACLSAAKTATEVAADVVAAHEASGTETGVVAAVSALSGAGNGTVDAVVLPTPGRQAAGIWAG